MASKNYEDKTLEYLERMTVALEEIAVTLQKMQQGDPTQARSRSASLLLTITRPRLTIRRREAARRMTIDPMMTASGYDRMPNDSYFTIDQALRSASSTGSFRSTESCSRNRARDKAI